MVISKMDHTSVLKKPMYGGSVNGHRKFEISNRQVAIQLSFHDGRYSPTTSARYACATTWNGTTAWNAVNGPQLWFDSA